MAELATMLVALPTCGTEMNWNEAKFVDLPIDDLASPALDWAVGYMLNRAPHALYTLAINGNLRYSVQADVLETAAYNKIIVVKDGPQFMARGPAVTVYADTPQLAVMRCMLKMRYGDTVQVPEDLLGLPVKGTPKTQLRFMDFQMPRLSTQTKKRRPSKKKIKPVEQEDYSAQFAAIDEIARSQKSYE